MTQVENLQACNKRCYDRCRKP